MRITRVQLENIKSYRRVSVPLGAGTIAIRGQNGAGKSTLVEAIGFALFDALNYDQAQFVREGERSGTVTVTFVSALDDREYQAVRRCGSAASWYIYDPDLAGRVVEQPVVEEGSVRIVPQMKITLVIDHRVADGVAAALFLRTLSEVLESPKEGQH